MTLAMAATAAKAEDQVTIKEIHDLKMRLRELEHRMDKQAKVTQKVLRREAVYPPPGAPYTPPMPWDKKFHLNGITLTPGGFLAAEGVWRSRDTGGDFSPAFGSIDEYNSPLAHMNEIRGTARQSRVSLLAEGEINPTTVASAYGEFDFLASGITANSGESNSYSPRVRHLYGALDWNDIGVHLLAGQTWSLVTMSNKGITPRNEVIPLTIDAQYVAGFTWTRQPQVRLVKNFGNTFWLAASAEMPQTTGCPAGSLSGSSAPGASVPVTAVNGNGVVCNQLPSGGSGQLDSYNYYSINHVPDVIAKAAWEPTVGDRKIHVEAFGLYTDLYDYVENGVTVTSQAVSALSYNNSRYDTTGWGAGGGILIPILPKWVDVNGSAMIGRGIGRYGSGQLSGATFNPDGSLDPVPEVMYYGNLTVHATPQLDLYVEGGEERILSADAFSVGSSYYGYSPTNADNSGCFVVNGTCKGVTEATWEATVGFWDKIYEGNFGSVRVGLQYAYIERELFPGTNSSDSLPAYVGSPWFNEQEVYASFRYYPFDAPPVSPPLVAKY